MGRFILASIVPQSKYIRKYVYILLCILHLQHSCIILARIVPQSKYIRKYVYTVFCYVFCICSILICSLVGTLCNFISNLKKILLKSPAASIQNQQVTNSDQFLLEIANISAIIAKCYAFLQNKFASE